MKSKKSFTLVEIMIAVVIIGLLLSFAVPAVFKVFGKSQITRFVNDLKIVSTAFEYFNFEKGFYPPDAGSGQMPEGMKGYLRDFPWGLTTCIGGSWDWKNDETVTGGIAVEDHTLTQDLLSAIDEEVDDGDLSTGQFTGNLNWCVYSLN